MKIFIYYQPALNSIQYCDPKSFPKTVSHWKEAYSKWTVKKKAKEEENFAHAQTSRADI